MNELELALIHGIVNLGVTLVGLGSGWLIGQRLTYQWNIRQKHRETDLVIIQDMQALYGEFFQVWKLWNAVVRRALPASKVELLQRAVAGEGRLERVLVKLASERHLSTRDRDTLGRFRQAYQQLRRVILDDQALAWDHDDHPEYLAFKRLALATTQIVQREQPSQAIGLEEALQALRDITANKHETKWFEELG